MTEDDREDTWAEENLLPDYQEIAREIHLPLPKRVGYGK